MTNPDNNIFSIFSIICKLNKVENISFYEAVTPIKFDPNRHKVKVTFDNLERFPIWHMGDKQWHTLEGEENYVEKNK